MSFESPDTAKDFPGLYAIKGLGGNGNYEEDEDKSTRRRDPVRRRESQPGRKAKGYKMFEEEDSEGEFILGAEDATRSPTKMKKHSKPSFKFAKRDKFYKPKEKERDKSERKEKERGKERDKEREKQDREREKQDRERAEKEKPEKEVKKKEEKDKDKEKEKGEKEKVKWKKKKLVAGSKAEQQPEPDSSEVKPIFGVPLAVAVGRSRCHDGIQLPVILRECIDYVEDYGLNCEGIYRISGVKSKVQALRDSYNRGLPGHLSENEPNIVASLMKLYLRELPEPVLTKELMPKFEEASTLKNVKQKVEMFQQYIEELPVPNKTLLSWMIVHMTRVIAREKQNKMSLQNVSIVLSPTMKISHRVLNVLFTYSKILFRDTVIKKYAPPLRPVSSRWSLELPESPSAIEEELRKQDSLLNQLHEELMKGKDAEKEEQVWEVQRVVTQLNRKLKSARKAQDAIKAANSRDTDMAHDKQRQALVQEKLKLQQKIQQQMQQQKELQQLEKKMRNEHQEDATSQGENTQPEEQQSRDVKAQQEVTSPRVEQDLAEKRDTVTDTPSSPPTSVAQAKPEAGVEKEGEVVRGEVAAERLQDAPAAAAAAAAPNKADSGEAERQVAPLAAAADAVATEAVQDAVSDECDTGSDVAANTRMEVETAGQMAQQPADEAVTVADRPVAVQPSGDSGLQPDPAAEDSDSSGDRRTPTGTAGADGVAEPSVAQPSSGSPTRGSPVPGAVPSDGHPGDRPTTEAARPEEVDAGRVAAAPAPSTVEPAPSVATPWEGDSPSSAPAPAPAPALPALMEGDSDQVAQPAMAAVRERAVSSSSSASSSSDSPSAASDSQGRDGRVLGKDHSVDTEIYVASSSEGEEEGEDFESLQMQHNELIMEEEELLAIGDELRQKIETEQSETERLRQEVTEVHAIRADLYSSDEYSDTDSDDSDDEPADLSEVLGQLLRENAALEIESQDLCDKVHEERTICLNIKVQIRMLQQRQLESSADMLLFDDIPDWPGPRDSTPDADWL